MELVGPDHATDRVPAARLVEAGETGVVAGDLDEHLGAGIDEELEIAGHLVVLPDVVGDRDADVDLTATGVGIPASGVRIQVQLLAFLTAVTPRLPREHRALVSGLGRGGFRLSHAEVSVAQQRPGQRR